MDQFFETMRPVSNDYSQSLEKGGGLEPEPPISTPKNSKRNHDELYNHKGVNSSDMGREDPMRANSYPFQQTPKQPYKVAKESKMKDKERQAADAEEKEH
jgi:hypothetical protein